MSDDVPRPSPWIGSAYRHVPPHADVLNFEFAGLHGDNRWNLVIFLDKVPLNTGAWIMSAGSVGRLLWDEA